MDIGVRNIKAFDGEKYYIWKIRVRALLEENDLLRVIDEEQVDLSDAMKSAQAKARKIIIDHLSDSFLCVANNENNAKQIFENLDSIYDRKSVSSMLSLLRQLSALKLEGDTPLLKHFNLFDNLILSAPGVKLDEIDQIAHLLLTLPPSYDRVAREIETLPDNCLTIVNVKTRLLDHEAMLKIVNHRA